MTVALGESTVPSSGRGLRRRPGRCSSPASSLRTGSRRHRISTVFQIPGRRADSLRIGRYTNFLDITGCMPTPSWTGSCTTRSGSTWARPTCGSAADRPVAIKKHRGQCRPGAQARYRRCCFAIFNSAQASKYSPKAPHDKK